jgi:hypothetical protein
MSNDRISITNACDMTKNEGLMKFQNATEPKFVDELSFIPIHDWSNECNLEESSPSPQIMGGLAVLVSW